MYAHTIQRVGSILVMTLDEIISYQYNIKKKTLRFNLLLVKLNKYPLAYTLNTQHKKNLYFFVKLENKH